MTEFSMQFFAYLYRQSTNEKRGIQNCQDSVRNIVSKFGPYTITGDDWFARMP